MKKIWIYTEKNGNENEEWNLTSTRFIMTRKCEKDILKETLRMINVLQPKKKSREKTQTHISKIYLYLLQQQCNKLIELLNWYSLICN